MRRGLGARSLGMNASQLSITRTVSIRCAAIAARSRRTVSPCELVPEVGSDRSRPIGDTHLELVGRLGGHRACSVDEEVDASGDGEHLAGDVARLR